MEFCTSARKGVTHGWNSLLEAKGRLLLSSGCYCVTTAARLGDGEVMMGAGIRVMEKVSI